MEQKKEKKYSKKIGIWVNEKNELDKFGKKKKTFTGKYEGEKVVFVKNEYKKEGSNEPDYNILFYPLEPKTPSLVEEDTLPF